MSDDNKTNNGPTELDVFIPQDGANGTTKWYYLNSYQSLCSSEHEKAKPFRYIVCKGGDLEASAITGDFDPFKAREELEHPVSDCDTLTHLLKASLGTGILAMPFAFKASGLILGLFATIAVSVLCTHCAYILVVCAHELYKRTHKTSMSFAEVAEEAFLRGPKWGRKFASAARETILKGIFITYFLTCSCYSVIVATNFQKVANHYLGYDVNLRLCIALLLIPLILLAWIPNLKYLAPVSMVANVFMGLGLGITFYYLVMDLPDVGSRPAVNSLYDFPVFFSITIFAIEAIGVVMPLENNMGTPKHFVGLCGVLNQGMGGVTLVYMLLGFLGYLKYGVDTEESITLNLPIEDYAGQAVQILIGLAVFCTFGLQFYVCLDIAWNGIKDRFPDKKATMASYTLRTVMVIVCVALAVAVPTIGPFVSLIGAFCFSILGLMCPVFIEIVTFWEQGFGRYNWRIWKNVIVILAGSLAFVFGTKAAVLDIIKAYTGDSI